MLVGPPFSMGLKHHCAPLVQGQKNEPAPSVTGMNAALRHDGRRTPKHPLTGHLLQDGVRVKYLSCLLLPAYHSASLTQACCL